MKHRETIALVLMILSTGGTLAAIFGYEQYRRATEFDVLLIARAPEYGNWDPRTITVPRGQPVRLHIRNIDTVSHGFALPAFDVAVREIKAGTAVTTTFTPDRAGEFLFVCTVWCSEQHLEMTGKLVVQ